MRITCLFVPLVRANKIKLDIFKKMYDYPINPFMENRKYLVLSIIFFKQDSKETLNRLSMDRDGQRSHIRHQY